jgi:hypothetical protein
LSKVDSARFGHFLLGGEYNLVGETIQVDLFQDVLTLDYQEDCPDGSPHASV